MSLIDDLFCYFSQPWMSALYQEAFVEALADIDEPEMYAQNKNSEDKVSFREKVRDIVGTAGNEQLNCTENAWMRLRAEVRSLWSRSAGERNVLDHIGHYLHDRGADGDRYSTPILRQDFYGCK
ncbi:hypothetical protein EVAR_69383_1 [Eumeta japonica]|uniref:Uncharacterized protein n=1 Tax=Eumeta variegata TaxID=151549 RepID=A0A4C1SLM2_EUMVA|nr:hypothetical protein EVAR_69383_1 [Eumeta japonica]